MKEKDTAEPRVTIIIVTWNSKSDILHMLDSLTRLSYTNRAILVVDNASTDGSVEAIKAHPLALTLLANPQNLGGTGGFNTGIHYALQNLKQDYLWLLDNDAAVQPDTLTELVRAAESDPAIGVAGSCIMSPENRELIVEAGGFVSWQSGVWRPNLRYQRAANQHKDIVAVDYVPACSALLRDSVARLLGGMDDRFFLHWDDIDYCLTIKEKGFRVVAVLPSKVYHSVEKGFNPTVIYYDFRNGLLVCRKHRQGLARMRAMFAILNSACRAALFFSLNGEKSRSHLIRQALTHFRTGRFGRLPLQPAPDGSTAARSQVRPDEIARPGRSVLLCTTGTFAETRETIAAVRQAVPACHLTLLVQRERNAIFADCQPDDIIPFDLFKDPLWQAGKTASQLLLGNFACVVSSGTSYTLPYTYLFKRHFIYDPKAKAFFNSPHSFGAAWKILLSLLAGFVGACTLLPIVFFASPWQTAEGSDQGTVGYCPTVHLNIEQKK